MVPGPNQIVACPSCGALAKYGTLASGNTFGARIWTDGRRHYPMLPRAPAVVKCSHCNIVHWLSEARKVGRVELWGKELQAVPSAWRSAENVQEPDEFQYYEALRAGLARTREQERNLRIFAWWRANDAYERLGMFHLRPSRRVHPRGRRIFKRCCFFSMSRIRAIYS